MEACEALTRAFENGFASLDDHDRLAFAPDKPRRWPPCCTADWIWVDAQAAFASWTKHGTLFNKATFAPTEHSYDAYWVIGSGCTSSLMRRPSFFWVTDRLAELRHDVPVVDRKLASVLW